MTIKRDNGFHESVRFTMFVCRIIGILPISGLQSSNSKDLRITHISLYTIYYLITVLLLTSLLLLHFYDSIKPSQKFKDLGGLLIQITAMLLVIILIRLTLKWKEMMKQIELHERLLPVLQKPQQIFKKINHVVIFFIIFGTFDFLVILFNSGYLIIQCSSQKDQDVVKTYYLYFYRWFYEVIPFSYGSAFILQVGILQTVTIDNMSNVIVLVAALYLIYRFHNFNRLLRVRQKESLQNAHVRWSDLQIHYTRLSRLVSVIDAHMSPIILLVFLTNLIMVCKQIYDIIIIHNEINNVVTSCSAIYRSSLLSMLSYFIKFIHTLSKSIFLINMMARVNQLSREPLQLLHTVTTAAYNPELQRFMDQVYHSNISLSGLQLFHLNKGTILYMFSTIVTYELVLLQLPLIYGK